MLIVAIDCGLYGAVATLDTRSNVVAVYDTPTKEVLINGHKRRQYLPLKMSRLIREASPMGLSDIKLVVIEHAQSYGIEGSVSSCSIGVGFGMWQGIVAALELPYKLVRPNLWKAAMRLNGDKEESRLLALELFPILSEKLKLKKHDSRAESLLLALYAKKNLLKGKKK